MKVALDTSVLLDVLGADSQFGERSRDALKTAAAAVEAGRRWKAFRSRGGPRRERVVADFLVGSHALLCADALLTRDRGFYRTEFSGLRVLEP